MPDPEITKAEPVFSQPDQEVSASPPPKPSNKVQPVHPPKKEKEKALPPQFVVAPEPKTPWGKLNRSLITFRNNLSLPQPIKIWGPRIAVLVISITLIIAVLPFISGLINNFIPKPTPTPTPAPTQEPSAFRPSPYAYDEVILAIEKKIAELEQELKTIEFREDALQLPNLDWSVQF